MAYLQQPQLNQTQSDVLIENLNSNTLLPKSPVSALNKGLNTVKQNIIQAVNEVLAMVKTIESTNATSINQQNSVIGNFTSDPSLLVGLKEIDKDIISAIIKINNEVKNRTIQKDIIFITPKVIIGPQKIEIMFPYSGAIKKILASLSKGTVLTKPLVFKLEYNQNNEWVAIDLVTIDIGQTYATKLIESELLIENNPLRLNIIDCQENLTGLVVDVNILTTI
jgi:hypothetical protein